MLVSGGRGRIGRTLAVALDRDDRFEVVGLIVRDFLVSGLDPAGLNVPEWLGLSDALVETECDVFVDFSVPEAAARNCVTALEHRIPVLVGTTGLREADVAALRAAASSAETKLFFAQNLAPTFRDIKAFLSSIANEFSEASIIDVHSTSKPDAPSASAKELLAVLSESANLRVTSHSIRVAHPCDRHEVKLSRPCEALTVVHEIFSAEPFIEGAVELVIDLGLPRRDAAFDVPQEVIGHS